MAVTITTRKKSPRAPSIPVDEAVERALKIYEKQGRHPGPIELVAQHLGYSGKKNGAALATIASLRYYGLLDRPSEGMLAVSKELESYKFAPTDQMKRALLLKWVNSPPVFSELLERYKGLGLPADANIKFDLVHHLQFSPAAADTCSAAFRRSVEVSHALDHSDDEVSEIEAETQAVEPGGTGNDGGRTDDVKQGDRHPVSVPSRLDLDRIPVRLTGGRKAWLEIPIPFFSSDKERLKAQIELLLTDDESQSDAED
ncbi:MAG: hypothetical protein Q7J42_06425 [Sulfuritalea sp.]|nr:hypothetical protein [Sulfuritalea sp.]